MLQHQNKPKLKTPSKKQSKKELGKRRAAKNKNQANTSQETLKRLNDLTSFLDNEISNDLLSDNKPIDKLKDKMNKLNLNPSNLDGLNSNNSNTMFNQFNELQIQSNKQQKAKANQHYPHNQHPVHNQQATHQFTYQQQQIHQPTKSRLPCYVANGQPLGYKQPSINYQIHQSISTNNFRSESGLSNSSSIVPSDVFNIHFSHLNNNCSNIKKSPFSKNNHSAPNSLLPTPSVSSPATPSESRRPSKTAQYHQFNNLASMNTSLNKGASIKKSLNNKAFRFEEYMPLCKVQNMLGKGQIVEGVLRINPRNFEDAYISAPREGEIDIRIYGKKNINRAFNNDVVAVQIKPIDEWNIHFNAIESNWASWKDELVDILDTKKLSLESKLNEQCLEGEIVNFNESSLHNLNAQTIPEVDESVEATSASNDSDEYESAREELDSTNLLDDRVYLTEEFWPDDKQYNITGFKSKSRIGNIKSNFSKPGKAADNTQRSFKIDGIDLRLLSPKDLVSCSFFKRCLQQTGKVVHILKSSGNKVCGGRLKKQSSNSDYVFFETTDKRIPNFLIPANECPTDFYINPNFYQNSLFLGEIKKWPVTSKYPYGRLVKMIGSAGEIDTETEILLVENNVDSSEFPSNIEEGLPITPGSETYQIPAKEIKKRKDLREELIFTIDPATARDLDDALSIKKISKHSIPDKEIYEVGVHIADVSYFVKEKLPIDKVAKQRTTSIYCVQKVIPMLPRILCEKYCSLNPGEEKLTFSVFWHMNIKGEIVKEWFERTVIKSAVKLSYDIAADMIDKPDQDWNSLADSLPEMHMKQYSHNDVAKSVNLMKTIATSLRMKRFKHGSLEITKPEVRFVLDETRYNVLGFTTDKPKSTFLVEEFMLLANISVAKKIYQRFPNKSFLRRHPFPERKMLNDFEELCKNSGLPMNTLSSKDLQAALNEIKNQVDEDSYKFLSLKLLKTMRPAEYFSTTKISNYAEFTHYALCVPIYTHFTSPIRRYPDIIVHRLLAASLNLDKEPKFKQSDLDELVTRCNDMKLANRIVGETSQKLFLSVYILSVGSIQQSAIVMNVLDKAFDCFLTKLNVTIRISCEALGLDHADYDSVNDCLKLYYTNRKSFVLIKVLTKVNLKITIPDKSFLLKWNAMLV